MKKQLFSSMLLCSTLFGYDLGVNISYDNLSIDQTNSNNIILEENTPKSNGFGLEVYYRGDCLLSDNPTIKNYISIKQTHTSNTDTYSLFGGINKEYKHNDITLYSGLLVGYGLLKYDYNPLKSSSSEDNTAGSFLYGLQLGAKKPIYNNSYLQVEARYIRSDYDTNLESGGVTSKINHSDQSSILVGLGYTF